MARYVVEKRLGAGGMAEVFRATRLGAEGFSRRVALKRVLPHWSRDENFARMFISEARMASVLDHPNIVSVLDFDRDENQRLYLAMEYVEGCDAARLRDQLAARGQSLATGLAIFICGEVLRGLEYAHRVEHDGRWLGIVHRDVSPHNVLIGRSGAVKLADFGIAKATAASTHSGMVRGKLAYMSPEQANGQPLDGRSDLFAAGVMLYELASGARPFDGETEAQTLANLLLGRHTPLGERAPWVPWDVQQLCARLLQPDREQRFATAQEALRALVACGCYPTDGTSELAALVEPLTPPATHETPPPLPSRTPSLPGSSASRSLAWLGAAAAVALGLTVAVAAPRFLRRSTPTPAPAAVPAPVVVPEAVPDAGADAAAEQPIRPATTTRRSRPDWEVPRRRPSEALIPK